MKLQRPKTRKHLSHTQETILGLIKKRSLTTNELRNMTNSSFPPARIKNCRDLGLDIHAKEKSIDNRGKQSWITRYTLISPMKVAKELFKRL